MLPFTIRYFYFQTEMFALDVYMYAITIHMEKSHGCHPNGEIHSQTSFSNSTAAVSHL